MATINLNNWLKLEAKERNSKFVPYKENFVTTIGKGNTVWLKAKTVGQYFYYIKNGFVDGGTTVGNAATDIVINVPAKINIKNNSNKIINFIPYRENFQVEVKPAYINEAGEEVPAEEYTFEAETAGQVLYYMAQDTNDISINNVDEVAGGLDVTQTANA